MTLASSLVARFAGASAVAYATSGVMIPARVKVTADGAELDADWGDGDEVCRVVVAAPDGGVMTWDYDSQGNSYVREWRP